jgi:hypothetical protein
LSYTLGKMERYYNAGELRETLKMIREAVIRLHETDPQSVSFDWIYAKKVLRYFNSLFKALNGHIHNGFDNQLQIEDFIKKLNLAIDEFLASENNKKYSNEVKAEKLNNLSKLFFHINFGKKTYDIKSYTKKDIEQVIQWNTGVGSINNFKLRPKIVFTKQPQIKQLSFPLLTKSMMQRNYVRGFSHYRKPFFQYIFPLILRTPATKPMILYLLRVIKKF